MKAIQFLTLIIFTSALMGCQIEVAPFDENQQSGQSSGVETSNNPGSTDTDNGQTIGETLATSVTLYWSAPVDRENGDTLNANEIAGYEIRFKKASDSSYTNIVINDNSVDQYFIDNLTNTNDYSFEIAVFDTNGIYSDYVTAQAS